MFWTLSLHCVSVWLFERSLWPLLWNTGRVGRKFSGGSWIFFSNSVRLLENQHWNSKFFSSLGDSWGGNPPADLSSPSAFSRLRCNIYIFCLNRKHQINRRNLLYNTCTWLLCGSYRRQTAGQMCSCQRSPMPTVLLFYLLQGVGSTLRGLPY